jgi:hypothetical protein
MNQQYQGNNRIRFGYQKFKGGKPECSTSRLLAFISSGTAFAVPLPGLPPNVVLQKTCRYLPP